MWVCPVLTQHRIIDYEQHTCYKCVSFLYKCPFSSCLQLQINRTRPLHYGLQLCGSSGGSCNMLHIGLLIVSLILWHIHIYIYICGHMSHDMCVCWKMCVWFVCVCVCLSVCWSVQWSGRQVFQHREVETHWIRNVDMQSMHPFANSELNMWHITPQIAIGSVRLISHHELQGHRIQEQFHCAQRGLVRTHFIATPLSIRPN